MAMFKDYTATLHRLESKGRLRRLVPSAGVDFTSNDFLGFANSQRLKSAAKSAVERGVPIGSGGSRLLRGNHPEHEALESEAASFFGAQKALYFANGYLANFALFSNLPSRSDLIVFDTLLHASARDGIVASKARSVAVLHNDVNHFEAVVRNWREQGGKGRPWIAVESLYSMDGDKAPLAELADVATRHNGLLVIDEAHATAVLGDGGKGLASCLGSQENFIILHACGKALGISGALVTGPEVLISCLINRARPFIYSTAPSPLIAALVREALCMVSEEPERRQSLERLVAFAGDEISRLLDISPEGTHIQPIFLGSISRANTVAYALQRNGFDIRAIRPPTVPNGTARLRLSITLNVNEQRIAEMLTCLARTLEETPV